MLPKTADLTLDLAPGPTRVETTFIQRAILHTLAYADVFHYPLTVPEIHRYLTGVRASLEDVSEILNHRNFLEDAITKMGDHFMLRGRQEIVETRARRKSSSMRRWRDAKYYGRFLASLPFVRMVAVTGSLAMNNLEEDGDIDYFIVTTHGRLWTCRALCLLAVRFARLAGVNLCPNFFVSESALVLEDRSLYAAHELTQMIPLYGKGVYDNMRCLNRWTDQHLPNAQGAPEPCGTLQPLLWKRFLEFVFSRLPLQWFEAWEKDRKIFQLSRGQGGNPETRFSADVCKGHVDRHGQRIEDALAERLAKLSMEFDQ